MEPISMDPCYRLNWREWSTLSLKQAGDWAVRPRPVGALAGGLALPSDQMGGLRAHGQTVRWLIRSSGMPRTERSHVIGVVLKGGNDQRVPRSLGLAMGA